jgi:hypothetical protein
MRMTFRQFRNGLVGVILRAVALWRDIPPPGGTRVGGPEEAGPAGAGRQSGFFCQWRLNLGARCLPNWRNLRNGRRWSNPRSRPLLPSSLLARSLPSFRPSFSVSRSAACEIHFSRQFSISGVVGTRKIFSMTSTQMGAMRCAVTVLLLAVLGAGTDWLIVQQQLSFCCSCCFCFVLPLSPTPTTLCWS